MATLNLQHPHNRRSAWLQWMLATAPGSTLGALIGGALITAWLQPFGEVRSPLEAAAIGVPRTAGALGAWGAGIGVIKRGALRQGA